MLELRERPAIGMGIGTTSKTTCAASNRRRRTICARRTARRCLTGCWWVQHLWFEQLSACPQQIPPAPLASGVLLSSCCAPMLHNGAPPSWSCSPSGGVPVVCWGGAGNAMRPPQRVVLEQMPPKCGKISSTSRQNCSRLLALPPPLTLCGIVWAECNLHMANRPVQPGRSPTQKKRNLVGLRLVKKKCTHTTNDKATGHYTQQSVKSSRST